MITQESFEVRLRADTGHGKWAPRVAAIGAKTCEGVLSVDEEDAK
jgi:hypothetical protein